MTILITGAGGFVGRHLVKAMEATENVGRPIIGAGLSLGPEVSIQLDVTDPNSVEQCLRQVRPTHLVHLAGIAETAGGHAGGRDLWATNLLGSVNVATSILKIVPNCRMLSIGSGLIYGASAQSGAPLHEGVLLAPTNDYAASKAAADLALGAMISRGLKVLRLRPFNHTGPGQSENFVIPSFAAQIARIEANLQALVIRTGNLEAERDILDVADVVSAYVKALVSFDTFDPDAVLNIASGSAIRMRSLLDQLVSMARKPITVEVDPARLRPNETPRYVGDARLARSALSWSPQVPIETTLLDVLNYWRVRIRGSVA